MVEVMVVVVIIGILLNMAMPGLVRARESARSKACIKSMKAIDSAKEQYALDNRLPAGSADPGFTPLVGASLYLKTQPVCPSGGTYTVQPIGTLPTCNISNNVSNTPYDDHVLR